ncbi:hypothetical protein BDC45DRAFT_584571 [Circinella umbellata]|nr:hypothetical protein BDC45DRAFT_584571 [Circinella umbellata]
MTTQIKNENTEANFNPVIIMLRHSIHSARNAINSVYSYSLYPLARRTLVILTNEFYTSIMCSVYHNRTVSLFHQSRGDPDTDMWICTNHRRNIYPYRWFDSCERGIDENGENVLGRVMGGDLSAANNIGQVFAAYINRNGDPDSRPLYLRGTANQKHHIHAQMQEEEVVREEILERLHEGQGAQGGG